MTAANLMNFNRDQLSPTSNQLARWFSPELLAKASAGKLPTLNVEQTLSLEEFERSIQHSSATVHN
jgi:eukaryotic translation initiation factor 4E transporter